MRDWPWWRLPLLLRWYVAAPPLLAGALIGVLADLTDWRFDDLAKFLLFAFCGMVSVASTPRIIYSAGGATSDFSTVWLAPTAILLPPMYVTLIPIPMLIVLQLLVHRGIVYRRVFTAAATSLSYAAASAIFRLFPLSFAGGSIGVGMHAFTWCIAVVACEIIGSRVHHFMIVGAVKMTDPNVKIWSIEWNREAMQGLFVEIDLAVLITISVALSPALVVLALPTVFLVRRFLIHPSLVAQSRVDAKTGLLNVSTWEREAEGELSRSIRTRSPMAVALVDIDHFKTVNDTYGHLAGDRVLKAAANALTGQLRGYDRAGRFGGEEFVLLLAQASEDEACRIAERLRRRIGEMTVPVSDSPGATCVRFTISIGVTALEAGRSRELTDMLAAADSALYQAKQAGRNRVSVARFGVGTELRVSFSGHPVEPVVEPVRIDPAGASLGLAALRSVSAEPRRESAAADWLSRRILAGY